MKRFILTLALLAAPLLASAQPSNSGSSRAQRELNNAFTTGGRFGVPRNTTATLPTCDSTNVGAVRWDTTTSSFKTCNGTAWSFHVAGMTSTGVFLGPDGAVGAPTYSFSGQSNTGMYRVGSILGFAVGGTAFASIGGTGVTQLSTGALCWTDGSPISGTTDLCLRRDAANVLAQYNGTTAQAFRIYDSRTDGSNYERGGLRWSSNVLDLFTESAGTGSAQAVSITSGTGHVLLTAEAFADLGTPANGAVSICSDCTVTGAGDNTCAGSGTGALAVRLNGVWRCFNAQN